MSNQPKWKLIAQLGDVDPIDSGGYFIYIDETGVYDPQAVYLESPDNDEGGEWTLYRFDIDKCTLTTSEPDHDGSTYTVLSDNKFHPLHPAWFAGSLASIADSIDESLEDVQKALCSDDVEQRAHIYREIGLTASGGWANLDSYPLTFKTRAEVEQHFDIETEAERATRRPIHAAGFRAHELSDRPVKLTNAMDSDTHSRYGVEAKTGDWIVYRESDETAQFTHYRQGRVLGRVEAPEMLGQYPSPEVKGHIAVLALADDMFSTYIRWVKPEDVSTVSTKAPAKLLAWITGAIPKAEIVYKLSHYGTLNERSIDSVQPHTQAFEAGISPFDTRDLYTDTNQYEVVVGNLGTVYSGTSLSEALKHYKEYREQSLSDYGRASGESITVMKNGEPRWEHEGRRTE